MDLFVDPTRDQLAALRAVAPTGPLAMLNLVALRERAAYDDAREASGAEAYRTYGRASAAVFARVGGRRTFVADFVTTVIGPEDERWDVVFVAEYPGVDAFVAMLRDPEYREAVKHRQAAVATSRLVALVPRRAGGGFGEAT